MLYVLEWVLENWIHPIHCVTRPEVESQDVSLQTGTIYNWYTFQFIDYVLEEIFTSYNHYIDISGVSYKMRLAERM